MKIAPAVAWESKRLMHDLRQALTLAIKLDEEKGIEDDPIVTVPSEDQNITSEENPEPQPDADQKETLEQADPEKNNDPEEPEEPKASETAEGNQEPANEDKDVQMKEEKVSTEYDATVRVAEIKNIVNNILEGLIAGNVD